MKRPIRPSSTVAWWTFWLGTLAVVLSILLPSLGGLLASRLAGGLRIPIGFNTVLLGLVLAIAAVATGIVAFRRGDRSWMALLAFVDAVIVGGFWIIFVLGEVIWPH